MIVKTQSEEETIAFGRRLAQELGPGVVLLIGELGAGKTTLAKGIMAGSGVAPADDVSSPTFTLIHEYGPGYYHIDLYRLETEIEAERLGLRDIFDGAHLSGLVLIEWGERFPRLLPERRVEIYLTTGGEDAREIRVERL